MRESVRGVGYSCKDCGSSAGLRRRPFESIDVDIPRDSARDLGSHLVLTTLPFRELALTCGAAAGHRSITASSVP